MGRRTWIKIFCEKWLRGSIRQETPEVRGVWVDLLALAGDSAYGDIGTISLGNECGLTDEQIAKILNINLSQWIEIKKRLIETDRIAVNGYNEIHIVNWKKYQSEYARQKKYRKKLQSKVTSKSDKEKLQKKLLGEGEGEEDNIYIGEKLTNTIKESKINKEKERIKKKKVKKKTNPNIKKFIDTYYEEYKKYFGEAPEIKGGKDGSLVEQMLSRHSLEKLISLLPYFWHLRDRLIDEHGHTIGMFKTRLNKLIELKREQERTW